MNRLLASLVAFALAVLSWNCTPPNNPPANCVYTVQLAQHPGPFRGAGVPAGGGDYSVDVLVNLRLVRFQPARPTLDHDCAGSAGSRLGLPHHRGRQHRAARRTGTAYVGYQALTVDQPAAAARVAPFR